MKNIHYILDKAIENYLFDYADSLYLQFIDKDDSIKLRYSYFLYQTGQLKKLHNVIENIKMPILEWDSYGLPDFFELKILLEKLQSLNYQYNAAIEASPILVNIIDILKIHTDLKNFSLLAIDARNFFQKIYTIQSFEIKAYISKILIDYFLTTDSSERELFFTSFDTYLLDFLHFYSQLDGPRNYLRIYNSAFKEYFNFQKQHKIAFCFFGTLRSFNWQNNLSNLINKTAGNLNADSFLFTWDEYQLWPGLMGGYYWSQRCFIDDIFKITPSEILSKDNFRNLLPSVYAKLDTPIKQKLTKEEIDEFCKNNQRLKKSCFIDFSTVTKEEWACRNAGGGGFMYYGISNVFKLLQEYERENCFEYDYIVLMRTDSKIQDINKKDIIGLNLDEISDDFIMHWGSGSGMCIAHRDSFRKYANIYNDLMILKKHKYINYIYNNHEVLYKYASINGINTIKNIIDTDLYNPTILAFFTLPDIKSELKIDCEKLLKNGIDRNCIDRIKNFFMVLYQHYPKYSNVKSLLNFDAKYYSAKARIENHLSYKIGKILIDNSKSTYGYIKMPWILIYVLIKHKKQIQKDHQRFIKEPKFALQPLENYADFNEGVKIKNYFSYKLGQKFIQACKNWHKGGLIYFLMNIKKIKKELK